MTSVRPDAEGGLATVEFILAAAISLVLFVALANLLVMLYGRAVLRAAVDEGLRSGTAGGAAACQLAAGRVLGDVAGGSLFRGVTVSCSLAGSTLVARGEATVAGWLPLVPDLPVRLEAAGPVETP